MVRDWLLVRGAAGRPGVAGRLAAIARSSSVWTASIGRSSGSNGRGAARSAGRAARRRVRHTAWAARRAARPSPRMILACGRRSPRRPNDIQPRVPRNGTNGPFEAGQAAGKWCVLSTHCRTGRLLTSHDPTATESCRRASAEERLEDLDDDDQDEVADRHGGEEPEGRAPRRTRRCRAGSARLGHDEPRDDAARRPGRSRRRAPGRASADRRREGRRRAAGRGRRRDTRPRGRSRRRGWTARPGRRAAAHAGTGASGSPAQDRAADVRSGRGRGRAAAPERVHPASWPEDRQARPRRQGRPACAPRAARRLPRRARSRRRS